MSIIVNSFDDILKDLSKVGFTLPNGTIFKRDTSFWKITGIAPGWNRSNSYSVVLCTKKGKEYKTINGFNTEWLHNAIKSGEVMLISVAPLNTKANLESGIKIGKIKRRIQFLQARLTSDITELDKLEKELAAINSP